MIKRSIPYRTGQAVTIACLALSVGLTAAKLAGVARFSWWWVIAPYLVPSAAVLGACVVYYLIIQGYGKGR